MQDQGESWYLEHVHNISRYFVENRQIAWVLLLFSGIFGVFGYLSMPQSKDPNVPVKAAMVIYNWDGQAPEKIEQLVTRKIEEALSQNEAVKKIESTVRVGHPALSGRRASVMALLPLSIDPHTVHALTSLWVRHATQEGFIRNPVQFEKPGFAGVCTNKRYGRD